MTRFGAMTAAVMTALLTTTAAADEWTDRPVRVAFGAAPTTIGGKFMRMDGCLYVRLAAARDGISLVRLDQLTLLQVSSGGGWVAKDVASMLAREPAHCLEEANG